MTWAGKQFSLQTLISIRCKFGAYHAGTWRATGTGLCAGTAVSITTRVP